MPNATFQTKVNELQGRAIPGAFGSLNPQAFWQEMPFAGVGGVKVGLCAMLDTTDNTVLNTGSNFIGFIVHEQVYTNYDMKDGYSNTVPEGEPVTVLTRGDIFVDVDGEVPAIRDYVYANTTTGALEFDSTTTAPTGTIATGFRVVSYKTGDNVALITNL